MNTRILILSAASVWAIQGSAQTIEIQGRHIKLQPKPQTEFWQEPADQVRSATVDTLPAEVDLSQVQSPVKDQANRGSCAYFTTVALFEHAIKKFVPDHHDVNLSEEYLIYANKALDRMNSSEDASNLSSNIRTVLRRGVALEETVPYSHSWFEKGMPCADFKDDKTAPSYCRSHYAPSADALQKVIDSKNFQFQLDQLKTMTDVMNRLAEGYAVTISVPVNQNGWNSEDGRVEHSKELEAECKEKPDLCGGHTVLLTGYNQKDQVFYFKNSWGSSWGKQGYGMMPYDFVKTWSYGQFYSLKTNSLAVDLKNADLPTALSPVTSEVKAAVDSQGRPGVSVSLRFSYQAPVGTFYYVSLFPQLKSTPSDAGAEPSAARYQPISISHDDGSNSYVSDFRYVIAKSTSDLSYDAEHPFSLFIADEDLEKAGVKADPNLVLRPSIYKMSDAESYKVLYREYLPLPAAGS